MKQEYSIVDISIVSIGKTKIIIEHSGLLTQDSAAAKKRAWEEILDDLEQKTD